MRIIGLLRENSGHGGAFCINLDIVKSLSIEERNEKIYNANVLTIASLKWKIPNDWK